MQIYRVKSVFIWLFFFTQRHDTVLFQLLYVLSHLRSKASQLLPRTDKLVVVILLGVVLDQLLGHPPGDVPNGASTAHVSHLPQGGCNCSRQEPSPFYGDVQSLARPANDRRALQAVSELCEGGVSKRKETELTVSFRLV